MGKEMRNSTLEYIMKSYYRKQGLNLKVKWIAIVFILIRG